MPTLPNNQLVNVVTWCRSDLAFLQNTNILINWANKKFQGFSNRAAQLGDTVTFERPPRSVANVGLIVNQFQDSQQLVQRIVCGNAANVSRAFDEQQMIFNNMEEYQQRFGESSMHELGGFIEKDIGRMVDGTFSVITNQASLPMGTNLTDAGPYRFFGDGVTPINSFGQLAQMISNFKEFGAAPYDLRGILPLSEVTPIVNSGLNQFVMNRNEDIANSWELGEFYRCKWGESNLLPIHFSGTVGSAGQTLTLTGTNDPSGQNITSLTFSGATANDPNAVKLGDIFVFQDGVSGQPNLRFLTYQVHALTSQPVQFRSNANVSADASGNVVIPITPTLDYTQDQNQNLNTALNVGMQAKGIPSHRCGLLYSGGALYMAMGSLGNTDPFPSATETDPDTGAHLRSYHGFVFTQNQKGYIRDAIWGATLLPDYSMRIVFPL